MVEFEMCERVGKWFRHCDWTTVYDHKGPSKALSQKLTACWELPLEFAKLGIKPETYIGAVCLTCGKFIGKDGEQSNELV